jgi:amino acid adenylation domain-containing protein
MSAEALYADLKQRRVELWCQGKMLRFRAPDDVLDTATMAELRRYKKELIELVRRESAGESAPRSSALESTTVSQQAMYFLHLAAPYSPAYNVASAFRVGSHVDVEAVRMAVGDLVRRHDSLRSTIELSGGELLRRIHSHLPLDFEVVDVTGVDEAALRGLVKHDYEQPFDLATGPLLRTRLYRRAPNDWVFLLTLHHIIFDAFSLWILQDELLRLCVQHAEGAAADLEPIEASFSDFASEQAQLIDSQRGNELLEFWKRELSGQLPTLSLPLDFPRPNRPGLRGGTHEFRLSPELSQRLRDVGKQLRVTPFTLLLSIYKVLLHRLTGQTEMVIGTTTSGRPRSAFARTVGYFVNTLPLRSDFSGDPTFADFTTRIKQKVLAAIRHQDYPFAALVDRLDTRRDTGRAPVCNVMFGLQKPHSGDVAQLFNHEGGSVRMGDWQVFPFQLRQQEGQFDLTLEMFESGDSFLGLLKFDSEMFAAETAERMTAQYIQLADRISLDPSLPVSQYQLLGRRESERVVAFSNGDPLPESELTTAHEIVHRQAERTPTAVALVCGNRQWTYAELDALANRIARTLMHQGVASGDIVACCLPRRDESFPLMLAIMKAGAVYLPLDINHPPQRLRELVEASGAALVITDSSLTYNDAVPASAAIRDLDACLAQAIDESDDPPQVDVAGDALAYILYTSGSTGVPKGVCVSHQALVRHIESIRIAFALRATDRVLQFSNLTFDPSLEQVFAPWSLGAAVVMRGNEIWSPEVLCRQVRDERLTMINLPPAYFKHCASVVDELDAMPSLRLIILGGDVFPREAVEIWQNGNITILNAYGPTEAVITAATFDATGLTAADHQVPIGRPKPGSRAYVLDGHLRMCPIGVPGRLFLAGPMLASGYLNDADLTNQRFVADPFSQLYGEDGGGRMYDTGDLARWNSQGNLEFLGRADRQLKISGMRVETGEIEAVIHGCPAVELCHVGVRCDGDQVDLIAWIQPAAEIQRANKLFDTNDVAKFAQSRLPGYMVPRHWIIVPSMPFNASGKIDRTRLPEPDTMARRANINEYVPPESAWEKGVANIWAEELKVSSVGIKDNFFDLGGASLSSLRIVSRMNQEGLTPAESAIKPELLFEFQTIHDLENHLFADDHGPTRSGGRKLE